MFLKSIYVPDFRVLKDVRIEFEENFTPSIFPIGSLNGGGKSTLLQLIFILLRCSTNDVNLIYIENLLDSVKLKKENQLLATIVILDEKIEYKIHFSIISSDHFTNIIEKYGDDIDTNNMNWALLNHNKKNAQPISGVGYSYFIETSVGRFSTLGNLLFCTIEKTQSSDEVKNILKKISEKIFLAAPSTQIFLFLPDEVKQSLFHGSTSDEKLKYTSQLDDVKEKIGNFFTYDFLNTDMLIKTFKDVRDEDFRTALKAGEYGNNYQKLVQDFNFVLQNKKLTLNDNFDRLRFLLASDNSVELGPEDLSHGELKRLSLFVWIKYNIPDDAIVLMDEIEIALHPDWQYRIITDLAEWGPDMQFLLATHSYELCQGVTPAHVKELEPRLTQGTADGNE